MTFPKPALRALAVALAVLPLTACGTKSPGSPTSPSGAMVPAAFDQAVVDTAATTGYVITSIISGTSCPSLQFMIQTYLIKTSTATKYDGGSCASLKPGTTLTALNGQRPNSYELLLYATEITIQQTAPSPTPAPKPTTPFPGSTPAPAPVPAPVPFETTVTVSSLVTGSACPYREFMVGSYRLTTSAVTRYEGGSCADIVAGATLAIVATKGSRDSSVLVSTVTFTRETGSESPADEEVSVDVTVDSVVAGSSCPTLGFLVGPYAVTVTSATRYESGMCTDIKPGVVLRLTGTKVGDEHVLASRVVFPG